MDAAILKNKFIIFVMFGFFLLAMGNAHPRTVDIVIDGVPYAVEDGIAINLDEEIKIDDEQIEEIKDGVSGNTGSDGEAQPESL